MKTKTLIKLLVSIAAGASQSAGATNAGQVYSAWLKGPISAREVGLAQAATADEGITAFGYNPAALDDVGGLQVAYTHEEGIFGTRQDNLDLVHPDFGLGPVGIQVRSMYDLGLQGRDTSGNPTGTLQFISLAYGLALANHFSFPDTNFGLQVKGVYNQYGSGDYYDASAALDLGVRQKVDVAFLPPDTLSLGASVQNLGFPLSYASATLSAPTVIRLGARWLPQGSPLLVATDFVYPLDTQSTLLAVGAEYGLWKILRIRAGYDFNQDNLQALDGLAAGFGVTLEPWIIDYSYTPSWGTAGLNRLSVSLDLGPGVIPHFSFKQGSPGALTTTPEVSPTSTSIPTPAPATPPASNTARKKRGSQ